MLRSQHYSLQLILSPQYSIIPSFEISYGFVLLGTPQPSPSPYSFLMQKGLTYVYQNHIIDLSIIDTSIIDRSTLKKRGYASDCLYRSFANFFAAASCE